MTKHPKDLQIKDFSYNLPKEKVAKFPLEKRDESKLLICQNEKIFQNQFFNIGSYLQKNSIIIFNNTKVVEARLLFQKLSGTTIEIFCLEPADKYADITKAMLQTKSVEWKCLVGNAKKWKEEILQKIISTGEKEIVFTAKKISKQQDEFSIEFFWNDDSLSFAEVLHMTGVIPLPPYLHRDAEDADKKTYQTVYAKQDGSVAAPTAGLHFTNELLQKLKSKNIEEKFVTLHVGAGTFKPVKSDTIEEHEMHSEFFEVNIELIEDLIKHVGSQIIAVGTTTLRTLESLYWMGIKIRNMKSENQKQFSIEDILVNQWDAYELKGDFSVEESLTVLLDWMKKNHLKKLIAKTQILIAPPYKLKVANILITNFHQPKSTLLLLVAAVVGKKWKTIYDYALQNNFRFLSYGDACLLFNE